MDLLGQLFWLSVNVYFEARNQPYEGKKAVAHVVLNRGITRKLPIKEVIFQSKQFSWTNIDDPQEKAIKDFSIFILCARAAFDAFNENSNGNYMQGVEFYFNPSVVRPKWSKKLTKVFTIGQHEFYKK